LVAVEVAAVVQLMPVAVLDMRPAEEAEAVREETAETVAAVDLAAEFLLRMAQAGIRRVPGLAGPAGKMAFIWKLEDLAEAVESGEAAPTMEEIRQIILAAVADLAGRRLT